MPDVETLILWSPIAVSVVAILYGVISFWWLHWRRGRLIVSPPRSFMVAETDDKIIVELPLSMYNDGAAAIVVNNLMLLARQEKTRMLFRFEFTRDELGNEKHHWATPIAIAGREAVMKIFDFQVRKGETNLTEGLWDCSLLARLNSQVNYLNVSRFKLNVSQLSEKFAAADNMAPEYQTMAKRYLK